MLHVYIKPHPFQMEFGGYMTIMRKGIPSVCLKTVFDIQSSLGLKEVYTYPHR